MEFKIRYNSKTIEVIMNIKLSIFALIHFLFIFRKKNFKITFKKHKILKFSTLDKNNNFYNFVQPQQILNSQSNFFIVTPANSIN